MFNVVIFIEDGCFLIKSRLYVLKKKLFLCIILFYWVRGNGVGGGVCIENNV